MDRVFNVNVSASLVVALPTHPSNGPALGVDVRREAQLAIVMLVERLPERLTAADVLVRQLGHAAFTAPG